MTAIYGFGNTLHGMWVMKDLDSKFMSISEEIATMIGYSSPDDAVGQTDYDIPCKAAEFADVFRKYDKKVVETQKSLLLMDVNKFSDGWRVLITEKSPIINSENEVEGLLIKGFDVTCVPIFNRALVITRGDQYYDSDLNKPATYVLNEEHSPLSLTNQQEVCLFYLLRGKSAKEIGHILNISSRTVEVHLAQIKEKLGCSSKSQLIEKAIESGFLFYMPRNIIGI